MEKRYSILLSIFIVLIILTVLGGYSFLSKKSDIFKQIETEVSPVPTEVPSPQPTKKIVPGRFFLTIDSPTEGQTFSSPTILVKGRTVVGAEVWINEKLAKVDSLGDFSLQITLEEGENYLVVSAGNEEADTEVERMVYYEK